jgi:hypothetical protein
MKGAIIMAELGKQQGEINERNHYLEQLHNFLDLMQDAVNKGELERYEKMERDFRHVTEQMEYVGRRSN